MLVPDVLTLDLGSAYSKLALRRGLNGKARLLQDLPFAPTDISFLVPSVVARLSSGQVLIGWAALRQAESAEVSLYRNWKASLILGKTVHGITPIDAEELALQYLKGLRGIVGRYDSSLLDLPIRICVPVLVRTAALQGSIAEIARRAGWTLAPNSEVGEPESNLMGMLSRGANVVHNGFPQPAEMFERVFHGVLRTLLDEDQSEYGFLVVDVGAFTTDFGYVRIDASYWDIPAPPFQVVQSSIDMGVTRIDHSILDGLPHAARDAIANTTPEQWERDKADLYSGGTKRLPLRGGGVVTVGAGREADFISAQIQGFADAILQARSAFLREHGIKHVHATILTGGGINIPAVRRALQSVTQRTSAVPLLDLLDPEEPLRYAERHESGSHRAANQRALENKQLVRGGSAVGGCSVFVDWMRGS